MNKRNLLYTLLLVFVSVLFAGCSNETLPLKQEVSNFNDYRFIVHVDNGSSNSSQDSRAASWKKDWFVGDKIIMAVDGDDNKLCELVYKGNNDWKVSQISERVSFSNSHGTLTAVHSDILEIDETGINTLGDILYSQDGSYEKQDDIVILNLAMNKRPICRIVVAGMNPNYWIDGLKEYNKITSLSSMNWETTDSHMYKETEGDVCVFYGVMEPTTNDKTTIRICGNDGIFYERIYNRSLNIGDNIYIDGPLSNESNLWKKQTLVHSIALEQTELNLTPGDKYSIHADIFNKDADDKELVWSSSNSNIVTVDQNGNISALANGDAQILVEAKDGSATNVCNIHIRDIEDFVSFEYNRSGSSSWIGMGKTEINFSMRVKNNYSKAITINDGIRFGSKSTDVLFYLSEFTASCSLSKLQYGQQSEVKVHLLFSNNFSMIEGSSWGKQNTLSVCFFKENERKQYEKETFLPWDLYLH